MITSNKEYEVKGAIIVHSIEEALEEIKKYPAEDVYCIGGDSIYAQMLPYCDVAHVTRLTLHMKQTVISQIWTKMMNGKLRERAMSRHTLIWSISL